MAKACVAILHGWSDKGKSFEPLRAFLEPHGFETQDVFLGNYISMDDDVRVEDVARRMDAVIADLIAQGKLRTPFDLIVHSTGALVARQWMVDLLAAGRPIPVKRFVMLAPANYGSKLAAVGKSMIGRLTKGLINRLETGEEMLRALELASPYQWNLARRDVLAPPEADDDLGPYGEAGVWPFIIAGTRAYDSGAQQIVNENGSDGTVRVPAANLNAVGMTIDFTPATVQLTPWRPRMPPAPCAVLPERDHSEITHPEQDGQAFGKFGKRLAELIIEALECDTFAKYEVLETDWRKISNETAMLGLKPDKAATQAPLEDPAVTPVTIGEVFGDLDRPHRDHFHRYLQLVVMVRDNYGNLVGDYFLEFGAPKAARQTSMITFHRDVLESVHNNSSHPAYRCLWIDHTDLLEIFYDKNDELAVSLSAAPPGRNIKYFDSKTDRAKGQITIHAADLGKRDALQARLRRNQTHFIEVIIPRRPVEKVFSFLP
jgi:hypothetical protein